MPLPLPPVPRLRFLGFDFVDLPMAEVVRLIAQAATQPVFRYVATPNASHLSMLDEGKGGMRALFARADFLLLDSRVVRLVARLVRLPAPPVVPGSDLVATVFADAVTEDTTICVIGSRPDAIAILRQRYRLKHLVHHEPPWGLATNPEAMAAAVAAALAAAADYTFIAVGSPQGEALALRIAATGQARGVGLCCGAAIDFLTGTQRRAPKLMRSLSLEWAYRLAMNPRRMLRRYLVDSTAGLALVLRAALHR
ncbi:exopolysaccharide biosynthesis WecB/TagA/CpsF family protein [Humitalea rosea]|uniref:Exopolysaccharide biosynthesis WecB/TagA/CpsF family protein n=1 Tax=Humitalea rosea TaxID=990373 RepID=A0A2W7I4P8_9PROT|nr:WecB/TagA/CpsF family glycosyltransferase [Humitalea rosea]PZW40422.1 exopolysaccharide biosynthesis WecB/TagA/CpsF family protein [Humitalea rosea]